MSTVAAAKTTKSMRTRTITMTAMLAAISFILAFAEIPVPFSPSFARFDLSDLPALIGAFAYGPLAGVGVELIKNMLQLLSSSTGGVGELANFIMGASYVFTAGFIYKMKKTKKNAWISCMAASVVMGIVAALVNYYILLPLFENFMPLEQLIASFEAFIPFIHSKADIVLYNALPFNLVKGAGIGVITMLVYKKLTPILKGN
ncbi:MAG: ECF transporter S component [Lachnospiraceae bacterium]|nr:ECF transporter S component [Lachnospiraceae bacterium]